MSYYHTHQQEIKKLKLELQKRFPIRLFDQPVGLFTTQNANPIKIGVKGMADLRGWITINGLGIALEIEVKTGKSGLRKPQKNWQNLCISSGVIHIVHRDIKSTIKILQQVCDKYSKIIQCSLE